MLAGTFRNLLSKDSSRIRGFDGLRALAMTLVFLAHKTMFGMRILHGGEGVQLFFVLSGYLITGILVRQRARVEAGLSTAKIEMIGFFRNRSFRIFPPYYALLAVLSATAILGTPVIGLKWVPIYATFTTNLAIEFHGPAWPSLGHFWSLAVEEQFYLLAAPLFLLVPLRQSKFVVAGFLAASLAAIIVYGAYGLRYSSVWVDPVVNFGTLAIGGALRLSTRPGNGRSSAVITWGIIFVLLSDALLGLVWGDLSRIVQALPVRLPTVFAGLVIWGTLKNQDSIAVKFLEAPLSRFLGRISYAFYLWHYCISFDFLRVYLEPLLHSSAATTVVICSLEYPATVAIAILSWVAVEAPALRLRDKFNKIGKSSATSSDTGFEPSPITS